MNPITRMMKRNIKTPLKYALPLLFIGALLLVSTAGCTVQTQTTSPTNQADITSYPPSGQHSQLVQALAKVRENNPYTIQWLNDTTAQVTYNWTESGTAFTDIDTFAQFPTVDAATAYFYSLQPQYPLKDTDSHGLPAAYSLATGHDPTVIRALYSDGYHNIVQTDDVVTIESWSATTINQA
jgi:hypothetical protein